MATRKKPVTKQPAPAIDDDEPIEREDFFTYDAMAPQLAAIRAALGIEGELDATVRVYKVVPGAKRNPEVWEGVPEQYDLRRIAQDHGSGEYRYILSVRGADGLKVRRLDHTMACQLTPAEEGARNAALMAAANPPAIVAIDHHNNGAGEMRELVTGMMAGFQATIQAMTQARPDPLEEMGKLAAVMRQLMPAAAPTAAPGGDFMAMLNMVKTFNDVTGAGKTVLPPDTDPSTAILMKALDAFGPALADGLKGRVAGQGAAAPLQPAQAQLPGPIDTNAIPAMTADQEEDMMLFRLQLRAACKAAQRGTEAFAYADTIYSMLPDDAMAALAVDPAWFKYLTDAVPDCAQYAAWFAQVRAAVIEIGVEEGDLVRGAGGAIRMATDADDGASFAPDNLPLGDESTTLAESETSGGSIPADGSDNNGDSHPSGPARARSTTGA